jgi:short-subunit dehydrogenase
LALRFEESTVLLTGATGGIGQAIARALHARGAKLILTGRRAAVLNDLSAELGERVEVVPADLADREQVRSLGERPGIDVLVANAALPAAGRLSTFEPDEVDRALEVNLRAPIQLTLQLLPAMLERGSGHLVYVCSMAGKVASGGASVYSGTKFGLRGFAFALSEELRGTEVGVTSVFPGFIRDAGMFADSGVKLPWGTGTRTPEDVAAAVIAGIEKNRAEIDVAPFSFTSGARIFGVSPSILSAITRALGASGVSAAFEEGQRGKR